MAEAAEHPGVFDEAPPLASLLAFLRGLAAGRPWLDASPAGVFSSGGRLLPIPRIRLRGPAAGREPIRIGIFAGIHGDEAAGCAALAAFAAGLAGDPARAAGYEIVAYPVCNPLGYEAASRGNGAGKDLNREFWRESNQPEIRILERELGERRFHGIIAVHADDTCEGIYGYAHGVLLNEALLRPALRAAAAILPCDPRGRIDGFSADEGVIHECFEGVLAAPPEQRPRPFDLIFETPALAPFHLQVRAAVAALDAILGHYRGFISYAQDL
jgi:hypothetical protein